MKCKACKREIPDNSIFCNWCGERQIKEKKKKEEIRVPKPRQLKSGMWNIELRAEGMSITEPTAERAVAKAQAIRAGFVEAKKKAPGITLRQAIDAYIESKGARLSPSTVRGYRQIRDLRFRSVMDKAISIDTDWQKLVDEELRSLSVKSVRNAFALVSESLRYQKIDVPEINFPAKIKPHIPWLSPSEIKVFVKAVRGTDAEIPLLLGLHSLRRSEMLGLRWQDVDFTDGTIYVRGVMIQGEENKLVYRQQTKTVGSARRIKIRIPQLLDALKAADKVGEYVVSASATTIRRRIETICKQNGLSEISTHGLRHSFASLGFSLGLTEREVMEIGGWTDPHTVHSIYEHLAAEDRIKAENKLDVFFRSI